MEIPNKKQRIQLITTSHLVKLLTKIFLPFSLLSVILSYPFMCNFQALAYGLQLLGSSAGKNYMFLLCNGLLVFIATSSGLIGSSCVETDVKAEKAVKISKLEVEPSEPKGSNLNPNVVAEFGQREEDVPLVVENEGEEDRSMEEDEDEELGWMSNEELNKKCEDFIRKMKEGIQFEARQVIMAQ
ncbi:uncharacterized protein LOC108483112 [Gossypium arboreum]|uniref:Uncharacterized protein n=1 Tax=Gossypium arboreum TaxID=29729 RepID=A0ABR0PFC2_GOSAR|nr:uncharacterized protein LOC108483112 [Gossypium arboreum]KAK5820011.1 hypothetical protein PVK06_025052 [Gossypium arboreum]